VVYQEAIAENSPFSGYCILNGRQGVNAHTHLLKPELLAM
jgi:hypothetical protein